MINCNPETVSTDYDTSDRLYFEPLTARGRARIVRHRAAARDPARRHRAVWRPDPAEAGRALEPPGCRSWGPPRRDRPCRGSRALPASLITTSLGRAQPRTASPIRSSRPAWSPARSACRLVSPPSYVLGGRAMQIIRDQDLTSSRLPARHPAGTGAFGRQGALPERQDQPDQLRARHRSVPVRPLSVGRHRARRRLSVRRQGHGASWSAASWSISRKPAFTRGTRRARCRRIRWLRTTVEPTWLSQARALARRGSASWGS